MTESSSTVQRLREDLIHPDPLLDCLIEVCRLHGQAASRASLSAGLPLGADNHGRLTLELAERAAARAGMSARLQRIALAQIDAATLPAILVLHDNRACVLTGWDSTESGLQPRVLLPETGQGSVSLTADELASHGMAPDAGARQNPAVHSRPPQQWGRLEPHRTPSPLHAHDPNRSP